MLDFFPLAKNKETCSHEQMNGVFIEVPHEIAKKIIIFCKKNIDGCFTPINDAPVPDSPDPDKQMLGIRIDRTLLKRVKRLAAKEGLTVSDLVRRILIESTLNITLTAEDYENITKKTREAEERLKNSRRSS